MRAFNEGLDRLSPLPDDWQERLMGADLSHIEPEPVENLEPRCYEVTDAEAVRLNGRIYEPGAIISVEEVRCLTPASVRKFIDAGLIFPSQRDPRPTRYDRLAGDDDD